MTMTTSRTIPAAVNEYLALHHVITVSSPSFTGMPHADTVVYVHDDSSVYFHVADGTTLARNIHDSRYVSFTIDDYLPDWRKLRELQGVGRGTVLETHEVPPVHALIAEKFGSRFVRPPGRLHRLMPIEMHFVHYDESPTGWGIRTVSADAPDQGGWGGQSPVAARLTFEPGDLVLPSPERRGMVFAVVEGLVEVRTEGFGADQTVERVRPGQVFGGRDGGGQQPGVQMAHAVEPTVLLVVELDAVRGLVAEGHVSR